MHPAFRWVDHWIASAGAAIHSPFSWLVSFTAIVTVRFLLESFSSPLNDGHIGLSISSAFHTWFFFLCAALGVTLIFHFFTRVSLHRAFVITGVCLPLIWLAPLIDLFFGAWRGEGVAMAYNVHAVWGLFQDFITYFGPELWQGITIGIRIEIACILIGSTVLGYLVTRSVARSTLLLFALYAYIFCITAFPSFLIFGIEPEAFLGTDSELRAAVSRNIVADILPYLPNSREASELELPRLFNTVFDQYMIAALSFLAVFLGGFALYRISPDIWKIHIYNSRPERVAHYLLLVTFGFFVAYFATTTHSHLPPFEHFVRLLLACFAMYCAWMHAVSVNDIADEKIDAISNPYRPLANGTLSRAQMLDGGKLFFVLAIAIGYAASPHAALFVAGVICVYQVYSASGTRLKLVPIVPSFLIGIACVFAFSIGFFTGMPHAEFADIPRALIILIFCGYTLGATIRDLKDYEGDKAGGALTIPVLFGKKWGAIITGIAFSSSLLLAPLLFNFFPIMFLFSAPVAFLGFWLTVRSPYKEWPLFILYLLYFSFLFTLWVLQNIL